MSDLWLRYEVTEDERNQLLGAILAIKTNIKIGILMQCLGLNMTILSLPGTRCEMVILYECASWRKIQFATKVSHIIIMP